ncbi:MAG: polysaccharide deacetylase family protein [Betaproteobacteria bacterium]
MRAVITFHHLGDARGPLAFPVASFTSLVRSLATRGPPIVDLDRLLAPGAGAGVALVFDDGGRSVADAALPVLRDAGAPAHLFLCTGWPEGDAQARRGGDAFDPLDWGAVERLHRGGVAIESHTHGHPDLRGLDRARVEDECARADALIQRHVGRAPRYFAFPFGRHDATSREVASTRYRAAFGTRLARLRDGDDRYALPRLDAHYLRGAMVRDRIDGFPARLWLAARAALRRLPGRR